MKKSNEVRVHHEEKSIGVRVHKKGNVVRVHNGRDASSLYKKAVG